MYAESQLGDEKPLKSFKYLSCFRELNAKGFQDKTDVVCCGKAPFPCLTGIYFHGFSYWSALSCCVEVITSSCIYTAYFSSSLTDNCFPALLCSCQCDCILIFFILFYFFSWISDSAAPSCSVLSVSLLKFTFCSLPRCPLEFCLCLVAHLCHSSQQLHQKPISVWHFYPILKASTKRAAHVSLAKACVFIYLPVTTEMSLYKFRQRWVLQGFAYMRWRY